MGKKIIELFMENKIVENKSNFKIGILIKDFKMNKFEKEIIDNLSLDKNFKIFAILEKKPNKNFIKKFLFLFKKNSLLRNLEILFFNFIIFCEKIILNYFIKELGELDNKFVIDKKKFFKIIEVNPIYSKREIFSEYSQDDYNKIKNENLDIVVRGNVSEIFRNNKLKISKIGILSFHHGNNLWNRGGPPGFWETYLKKSDTGFVIQLLDEKLDDGKVLFRGEFATKRLYTINKHNLLSESNYFLIKVLRDILYNKNISFETKKKSQVQIFKTPKIKISINYILQKTFLFTNLLWNKFITKKKQTWFVCYSRKRFDKLNLKESIRIDNFKNRYFADPFCYSKNNKDYIFVEDYCFKKKKGSISVIEIDKENNQKVYENIIEENFHMSFPFIFDFQNELYMIPETFSANALKLYKCTNFPNKWEFCYNLISDIKCVDPIIIKYDNLYYLIISKGRNNFDSQLQILYSESPISQSWKTHKLNPVYFSLKQGRNGGHIKIHNKTIRVSQSFGINRYGDNQYGKQILLNHIKNITPEKFEEEIVKEIQANFKEDLLGIHHMNGNESFTVFDYCLYN